jgi:integrase
MIGPNAIAPMLRRHAAAPGVPRIPVRDFRHGMVTLLLVEGYCPRIVQKRLRHANVTVTLDRYSHVSPDTQREAAELPDGELLGS